MENLLAKESLILKLFNIGAVKFGSFTLKSGIKSPIYIDFRLVISYPKLLKELTRQAWMKAASLSFDLLCGVPYNGIPLATALSLEHEIPMILKRKEKKSYGTQKMVEGVFSPGQRCLILEDIITRGESTLETIRELEAEKLKIEHIIVLMDRDQGGKKNLENCGYHVHPIFLLPEALGLLCDTNAIDKDTYQETIKFIKENQVEASSYAMQ